MAHGLRATSYRPPKNDTAGLKKKQPPVGMIHVASAGASTMRRGSVASNFVALQRALAERVNELEASVSFQYRRARFEAGLQGTFGQSLTNGSERDLEARVYAVGRPTPRLALGVAAQLRGDVGEECTTSDEAACEAEERARLMRMQRAEFDILGGGIASFTYERWQLGALVGASTLGHYNNVGFIAQAFGSVRF